MMYPARAVVLGVDQATESGWCIHVGGRPIAHGTLNVWDWNARREVVLRALEAANPDNDNGAPRAFVFAWENHEQAPLKSYKSTVQVLRLGGAYALWFDSLNRARHPEHMRIGTSVRSWRTSVLGLKASHKRAECKAQALRWAREYTGKPMASEDEAEGICISAWGAREGITQLERARYAAR